MAASTPLTNRVMPRSQFTVWDSTEDGHKLGILCDHDQGHPVITLWRQTAQVDYPLVDLPDHLTFLLGLGNEQNEDISDKRRMAAQARWDKQHEKQRKHNEQCMMMVRERQRRSTMCDAATQTKISWVDSFRVTTSHVRDNPASGPGRIFLDELIGNQSRKCPRYSDNFYDLSALLYLSSAKAYQIMRQMAILPATCSLYRVYQETFRRTTLKLLDFSRLGESIDEVRDMVKNLQRSGQEVNPACTLAIDAFCFRSFSGSKVETSGKKCAITEILQEITCDEERAVAIMEGKIKFSYGFLFLLIPHDYRIPIKILHLCAAETGCYNEEIAATAKQIRQATNATGLRIWCKATDGDPGVSSEHNKFYTEHIHGKSANFQRLVEDVHMWLYADTDRLIPIADPLHVFKNVRAKLLAHPVRLFAGCPETSLARMREALELGNALGDETQTGKMRDSYVISLFTFENVIKLLESRCYVEACLLLPFACWAAVIFSCDINLQLRLFLVEFAFQLIMSFYTELSALKASGAQFRGAMQEITTFSDAQYTRRMLNTLVAFGLVLRFGSENVRMDALGTHLVENCIGLARASSSDPRYERIVQTYTHAEVRKEIAARFGITLHVQGRLNHGGCKVDPDYQQTEKTLIAKPDNWKVDRLLMLMRGICQPETRPFMTDQLNLFVSDLHELVPAFDKHHYNVNEAANCAIMARIVSFKKEKRV